MAPPYLTRGRKVLVVVAGLLILSLGFLALGEGVVRIRHRMKSGSAPIIANTYRIDPATGLRVPIPNLALGHIRINSQGFRSPELVSPKPANTLRLAFLGASTTFCGEVGNEMTWPHVVWQTLGARLPAIRFDYVNAGVPGYGYDSILKSFELRVKPLHPDIVVIYEATNDLSFESRLLARRQGLVGDRAVEESWLAKYSLLWFLVEKNLTIRRLQSAATTTSRKLEFDSRALSRNFEQHLRETVKAAQSAARLVAVATFAPRIRRGQPEEVQRQAAVTSLYYMPYMSLEGLLRGFEEYNRVIRTVATETGALLVEGEDRIPADGAHYSDSVHFTEVGNRVMAARISEALLSSSQFGSLVPSARAQSGGSEARR